MRSIVLAFALLGTSALACKVPVFRYALERWEADQYTLEYRDAAAAPQLDHHNLVLRHNPDLNSEFAAYYPDSVGLESPFWIGDDVAPLLDSPLRQQLLEMITAGASTVWILVEGKEASLNDATEEKLRSLLAVAAAGIEIPEGVVRPEQLDTGEVDLAEIDTKDVLRSPIPLKIDFEVLRLRHGDVREEAFRQILLGTHPNPAMRNTGDPVLVPVFGRGRMLEALPESMLSATTIDFASQYLCGECSCEVKDENPGADLLVSADWEKLLENSYTIIDQQLPPLTGAGEFSTPDEASNTPVASDEPRSTALPRNLFILAVATVCILTLVSVKILRPGE